MFQPVDTSVSFPKLENDILEWWNNNQIVEKSLNAGEKPFVFYEGPPTANGQPGFHHIISRIFKDVILRYRAMQGYRIIGRREGWDTHGLPVEIEVEKELGFEGKSDIENHGIAEFNAKCRESVWRYIQDWKEFTDRIAYWISEDAYITYENDYIESLWWVFRQLWDRGLLFRDYKVTMHCPRCDTSLSDHEVSQGFREGIHDPSVWVRFRIVPEDDKLGLAGSAMVAWTTTPWTLPANVALCVKPGAEYALVSHTTSDGNEEQLVIAAALVTKVLGEDATIIRTFSGDDLIGTRYEPLYQGVPAPDDDIDWKRAYHVIADDFVSLEDGTGIVHIAPAYGDFEIGKRYHLPTLFSVAYNGNMLPNFDDIGFGGTFFKKADPIITRNLKERGLLFKSEQITHSYPFCWRCDTPLIYFAKRSWYIRTTELKDALVQNNQQIYWVPDHIRNGRFGNWLENNIDWAISRERYWGTPIPIWISEDGKHSECIGSIAELEEKTGRSLKEYDLHRPYVDDLTWEDPNGHGTMRRISDVADCWFDSGAMQVAQWHYPFENEDLFTQSHPADYICEAIDQTRGWFYTLHALGTLLFNRPAFTHVICLGHILDAEGQKMSKSRGNVVNPWDVFEKYGVDALRWNLFSASPPGNPRRFSVDQVGETLRQFLLTLWNTYSFFVTYANLDKWTPEQAKDLDMSNPELFSLTDRWALARLNGLIRDVTASMEAYDVTTASRMIDSFVDELSNWYVRRNRRRFWKSEADSDKHAAYLTLYTCLITVAKLAAPFAPFISEAIYRNLAAESAGKETAESVHLAQWDQLNETMIDDQLVEDMQRVMRIVSLGRAARKHANLKVRQPLSEIWARVATPTEAERLRRFEDEIRDELNIKAIRYLDASSDFVDYMCKPNLRAVGKKFGKLVPKLTATLRDLSKEQAREFAHAVEANNPVTIQIDGQEYTLQPEELIIETSSPDGYAVAEGDGMLVALNTTITEELWREGAAREIVRNIQDARKNAGLDISDRITLHLDDQGAGKLQVILDSWSDYIQSETLAERLVTGTIASDIATETVMLDGVEIRIGIQQS